MTDLALDPLTGDLVIEAGDLKLIKGPEAVAQDANLRVALFLGEWPLDLRVGIDYRNLFFDRRPPEAVIRAVYEQVLGETAGVQRVSRLALLFDTPSRTLTVQATIIADDGTTVPVYRDILLTTAPPLAPQPTADIAGAL
jgi:hypothetical protein